MKTSKIGELNLGKFKTEIHTTEEVKKRIQKKKSLIGYTNSSSMVMV